MTRFEKERFMKRWSFALTIYGVLFLFAILASMDPILNYWLPTLWEKING